MKQAKKLLLLVLCAVLLVGASVAGTVAYLTAQDEVKNTFTVGNVEIKLDEAKVNKEGQLLNSKDSVYKDGDTLADRVKANEYHLLPGMTYVKDPTVWVEEGSETSYIRMKVTFTKYRELEAVFGDPFLPQNYVAGWDSAAWVTTNQITEDTANNTATYEFRYYTPYTAAADNGDATVNYDKLAPLFTSINFPGAEIDNTELATLEGLQITVVAEAIQAAGFENADAAWDAFGAQ